MSDPHLRIRASGYGGSGYFNPFTGEKVIGVTTALGAIRADGITQWAVDQTAAYAVANVDMLLQRDEERGFAALRWYHNRMTPKKYDEGEVDIYDYHTGVLNDLAELGTWAHEHAEAVVQGLFPPEPTREEHEEMADAFDAWWDEQEVRNIYSEVTVFGPDYGGTGDLRCEMKIDGEWTWMCIDFKTSRAVYDSHVAQLAAYGAADTYAKEVPKGTGGAVEYKKKWYVAESLPPVQRYAVLQIRPSDWDDYGNYIEPHCTLHFIDQEKIDAGYEMFRGSVQVRKGQAAYNRIVRREKKEAQKNE